MPKHDFRSGGWVFLFALVLAACNRSKALAQGDDAEAALTTKYEAMSPADRVETALNGCYVGPSCQPSAVEALFAAAADDAEREALRSTARAGFARQYQAA